VAVPIPIYTSAYTPMSSDQITNLLRYELDVLYAVRANNSGTGLYSYTLPQTGETKQYRSFAEINKAIEELKAQIFEIEAGSVPFHFVNFLV